MPAVRVSRRRRSSLALSLQPVKAGIYGAARPVTFAPNITPVSYVDPDSSSESATPEPPSPSSAIFPPSQTPAPPPTRRRVPPGKRRSLGYIPRPPNAFMLFRADFVRQKHVPGSIETNHGSLSKIIGNCWRSLPLDEKKVWEVKAKHAKAEHKARYPNYRFKPIHGKHKDKKKEKALTTMEDERRCEEVAQLLLEGKKGDELAAAVRTLDLQRCTTSPAPIPGPSYTNTNTNTNTYDYDYGYARGHRRSSSVPLPNDYYTPNPYPYAPAPTHAHAHTHAGIALPSLPFFTSPTRPTTPISALARQQRQLLGHRRASSARPALPARSWTMPTPATLTRDDSPLPEVVTSLFEPAFLEGDGASFGFAGPGPMNFDDFATMLPPHQQALGPYDSIPPHEVAPGHNHSHSHDHSQSWMYESASSSTLSSALSSSSSHPSSTYSASPAHSDSALPLPLHAPQPQPAAAHQGAGAGAGTFREVWKDFIGASFSAAVPGPNGYAGEDALGLGLGLEFCSPGMGAGAGYDVGYEGLFQPAYQPFGGYAEVGGVQE